MRREKTMKRAKRLFRAHNTTPARRHPPRNAAQFFQLVNARYEKGSMILTSNRRLAKWGDIFGDPVVATAPITPPPPGKNRG